MASSVPFIFPELIFASPLALALFGLIRVIAWLEFCGSWTSWIALVSYGSARTPSLALAVCLPLPAVDLLSLLDADIRLVLV